MQKDAHIPYSVFYWPECSFDPFNPEKVVLCEKLDTLSPSEACMYIQEHIFITTE